MPLKRGKSKKVVRSNIRELLKGPRFRRNKRKFGKKKAIKIAVAAAFSASRRRKKRRR
jgi:hypothetical protein